MKKFIWFGVFLFLLSCAPDCPLCERQRICGEEKIKSQTETKPETKQELSKSQEVPSMSKKERARKKLGRIGRLSPGSISNSADDQ